MLSEISCARPKLIGVPPCGVPISTPEQKTNMGVSVGGGGGVGAEARGQARRGVLELPFPSSPGSSRPSTWFSFRPIRRFPAPRRILILAWSWLILQWVSNPLRIEIDGGRRKRASFIASSEERDQPLLFVFERTLYRSMPTSTFSVPRNTATST